MKIVKQSNNIVLKLYNCLSNCLSNTDNVRKLLKYITTSYTDQCPRDMNNSWCLFITATDLPVPDVVVEVGLFSPLLLQVSDQMLPCCSLFAGSVWTYPYIFVRLLKSPCFHQNLMNRCWAWDGDLYWSDSRTTWPLPADSCRFEMRFLPDLLQNCGY